MRAYKQDAYVNLRRPQIPQASPVPRIEGPGGGLAYSPHPNDRPERQKRTDTIANWYQGEQIP